MSDGVADQIALFCSQVERRRFDDGTLKLLELALIFKDVKSLLEVQSNLRRFMRRESLCIIREIIDKNVQHKLSVLQFLVHVFALAGDIESCLALRYEALVLRELKSASNQGLQVSCKEWMSFAEHSFNNGFYSIARKACDNAVACFQINDMVDNQPQDLFENLEILGKIKKLKDVAVMSSASLSVQAQATEYLRKRAVVTGTTEILACKEAERVGSTLFRNGIKKRNIRKLQDHQSIQNTTTQPDPMRY